MVCAGGTAYPWGIVEIERANPSGGPAALRRLFRFGDVVVDVSGRELVRAGEAVPLAPAAFDCIAYLIEHRDRAVGRDELIAAVWGRAEVAENLLGKTIVKARRALGDSGDEQAMIRTVPRFGYHWVAPVQEAQLPPPTMVDPTPLTAATADIPRPAAASPAPRRRRWPMAVAASLLVAMLIGAIAFVVDRRSDRVVLPAAVMPSESEAVVRTEQVPAPASVAVLPVRVTAGHDDAWLRLGLMDLIGNRLRDAGIPVLPSASVVRLLGGEGERVDPALLAGLEADRTMRANLRRRGEYWLMHLELTGRDGVVREFQARSDSPIAVARQAADQALVALGQDPAKALLAPADYSLLELSQRAEAAILANDDDGARRLIAAAPARLQATPELQFRLAFIDYRAGRVAPARHRLHALLKESDDIVPPVLRARALTILAGLDLRDGQPAAAEAPLREAIVLMERHPDVLAAGHAHMGLGISQAMQGRYDQASDQFARARVAFGLAGDVHALARVDINEGAMDNLRDRPAEAMVALDRAARRFERLDAPSELGTVLVNQIKASLVLLDTPRALALGKRLEPLMPRLHNPDERIVLQLIRADILIGAGRLHEAGELLDQLDANPAVLEHSVFAAQRSVARARLALAEGELSLAADLGRRSTADLQGVERARDRTLAWRIAIQALLAEGRIEEAAGEVAALTAWAQTSAPPAARMAADLAAAQLAWARGDADQADQRHRGALQQAEAAGVPSDLVAVAVSYGQTLIERNRLPEAASVVGHVARWADRDFDSAMLQVSLYQALGETQAWQRALEQAQNLAGDRRIVNAAGNPPVSRL